MSSVERMSIRLLAWFIAACAAIDVWAAPRSVEMAIPRHEMIAVDGSLEPRAIAALERMQSMARDHGVTLTVQVPADAIAAASQIQRVAPMSAIRQVPARRPFKLVLRIEDADASAISGRRSATGAADVRRDARRELGLAPSVHIHIRSESQSDTARAYAAQLRRMGANVSDVEIIVADGPRRTQLRYFHAQDRAEAAALARSLSTGSEVQLLDLSREYGSSVPVHHYELWLAPTATALR